MALAPYFRRSAVAAAQVLSGFDEPAIAARLEEVSVGVHAGDDAGGPEGRAATELAVRLLARLYPRLSIKAPEPDGYRRLALKINPEIELLDGPVDAALVVGGGEGGEDWTVYLGSDRWDALLSGATRCPVGESENPLGAGAAVCLGASLLFQHIFTTDPELPTGLVFSTLELAPRASSDSPSLAGLEISGSTVIAGLGAIGNGVLWALARSSLAGEIALVDPEPVELSNLQRYVMATPADCGRPKVELAAEVLGTLRGQAHQERWEQFVATEGYRHENVLLALDSAADRRAAQDSLPRWIANAWTQPGDLGVSVHPWVEGACVACLYLRQAPIPSEDEQVATAMAIPHRRQDVRRLLVDGEGVPSELLAESAEALGIDPGPLLAFAGRPIRDIYVEGICGGAALPLDRLGVPDAEMHVPLAHQSALAGLLLTARLFGQLLGHGSAAAEATRIDVMGSLGEFLTQPLAKDPRGICICQDPVFQAAYEAKWARAS